MLGHGHIPGLGATERPTALFAASDELAAGAIGLCLSHEVNLPRDISIAGFDDDEIAQATWPALTTVRQPLTTMIERAMDLLAGTERDVDQAKIVCPVEIVIRESVGPAPNVAQDSR